MATHHSRLAALCEARVNKIPDVPEISALDSVIDAIAMARREAVDQFRIHLLAHNVRDAAAASGL